MEYPDDKDQPHPTDPKSERYSPSAAQEDSEDELSLHQSSGLATCKVEPPGSERYSPSAALEDSDDEVSGSAQESSKVTLIEVKKGPEHVKQEEKPATIVEYEKKSSDDDTKSSSKSGRSYGEGSVGGDRVHSRRSSVTGSEPQGSSGQSHWDESKDDNSKRGTSPSGSSSKDRPEDSQPKASVSSISAGPSTSSTSEWKPRVIGRARGRPRFAKVSELQPGGSDTKRRRSESGHRLPKESAEVDFARSSKHRLKRFRPDLLHTRPTHVVDKKGTSGTPVELQANYFKLRSVENWSIYQYSVTCTPEEERLGVRRALLRNHEKIHSFLFDGSTLFSNTPLAQPLEIITKRESDNTDITMDIKFCRQLHSGDSEFLIFFNILMKKCLSALQLQVINKNYFDAMSKICIDEYKLELWPGYIASIRQHERDILLCSEITHKVMRRETVADLLCRIRRFVGAEYQHTFKQTVLGLVVLTDYNNRTYRIDDVNFDLTPLSVFSLKGRRDITFAAYYFERYNLRITDMMQPLLVSKSKARALRAGAAETVFLVPELCRMTGITDDMRTNFQLMRSIASHTRVGPKNRVEMLISFSHRLMGQVQVRDELKQWQMDMAPKLVTFQGRKLDPEKIVQGQAGDEVIYNVNPAADWTWNLRANPLLSIGNLHSWVVMCPFPIRHDARTFIALIKKAAFGMSMIMHEPFVKILNDDRQGTYANELEKILSSNNPQMLVCMVSNNRADRYSAIKRKCLVDRSVPTQVITSRCLNNKGAMSIATKIAIQMNCKIGGAPWTVPNPCRSDMVVGFDVSHDTMNKKTSYGALIASLNRTMTRFFSTVSAHHSGEELSTELSTNLLKALQRFRQTNDGLLPARIFIYRDGVGDGQTDFIFQHELTTIKNQLAQLYGGPDRYRLTFIIVSKKMNTRIFSMQAENPEPGTVVDDCITLPERFDFYIVSQSVRQGTVSPTSYNVIHDNSGLSPDMIQRFTYKMTHLYFNWSGTVRVPAPVQYAHKLATLVGQALHRLPATELDDTLYFL